MTNPDDPKFVDDVIDMLNRSVSEGDFIYGSDDGEIELGVEGEYDEPGNQSVRSAGSECCDDLFGIDMLPSEPNSDEHLDAHSVIMEDGEDIRSNYNDDENLDIPNIDTVESEQMENVLADNLNEEMDIDIYSNVQPNRNEQNITDVNFTHIDSNVGRGIEDGSNNERGNRRVCVRGRVTKYGRSRGRGSVRVRGGGIRSGRRGKTGTVCVRGRGTGRGRRGGREAVCVREIESENASNSGEGTGQNEGTNVVKKLTKKQKERLEWNKRWLNVTNEDPGPVSC